MMLNERIQAPSPAAFFESLISAFESAQESAGGAVIRDFVIGGYTVRLQFAGSALVPYLTLALEHLAIPLARHADLTILLWDSASTHTAMPERPWQSEDLIARGDVRGFSNERFQTMLSGDVGMLSMLDSAEQRAVYWIREPGHLPTYERGSPLRAIFHWWMRQHGRVLVHAAAIGSDNRGVLVIGKSGSGKSTTALTCLLNGWSYAGDDYCLVNANGTGDIYSLYNSAKLTPAHIRHFPALLAAISNQHELGTEKALVYLQQLVPERMVNELPLTAIFVPQITGRTETTVTRATQSAALRALAPSSLFQLPGTGPAEFLLLADLVGKVPCYTLELGTDLEQIPGVMRHVLDF